MADRLSALLPGGAARLLDGRRDDLTEIRLRAGRPVQVLSLRGEALSGERLDAADLKRVLAALMDFSVYARQEELDRGYFTLDDGSRVGVCGRMIVDGDALRMGEIGSACVRVARAVPGCADGLVDTLIDGGCVRSALLVSAPGLGKTTLLRDIARQLSGRGFRVAVADERHELAACHRGVPTLDVGARTDVLDGCPRDRAARLLLRTMAPQVLVTDEIGGAGDARALADAARCGVAVVASAHGRGLEDLLARPSLRAVLEWGAFDVIAALGPKPGLVRQVWRREPGEGGSAWRRA